jgi:hypothetical protein
MTVSDAATSAAQEIVDHCDGYDESERLKGDIGPLELARTQELMRRTLPRPPAVVLDVGGGPGGVLLAFAITRYAGLIYGLLHGLIFDDGYRYMIETEVRTGRREDPPTGLNTFPSAYFHHPDGLAEELREASLEHEATLRVLGPAWMVPDLDASWADAAQREVILEMARLTERKPMLGPRLMAVGRKAPTRSPAPSKSP